MKNTLETRLGFFVALVVIAGILIIETLGGLEQLKQGKHIHALFNTAQNLKEGDRVKMAGVEIGKVESVKLAGNKVRVTMKVDRDAPVKTDSIATIPFAGLGESYVAISFGSPEAPPLDPDQDLETTKQVDLGSIMQKLDNAADGIASMTEGFAADEIHNLMSSLTDFITRNKDPLSSTFSNLNAISSKISSGEGTVGRMIYDQALYDSALTTVSNLQSTADEIRITIAEARKVIDGVNSGEGSLGKLVKDETLYHETTASMSNLREILEKINQGSGTVGKLVNDQEFYKNAKLTLQKVDKATEGLEDQGPLSVIGILANNLF